MTLARIGRFEVQRPLGSGSFATVWLARDEDLDAWVAIKLLAENWSFNDDARRRFVEEARALRRLDNERIVRVYDVGSLDDGRPYMVMEYADRGSLEDRMRLRSQLEQPFSVREAVEQSIEMAECLSSVHDLRIVHRDVKPSNVLFRGLSRERQEAMRRDAQREATERTLLGDFGIARRLEGVLGATMVVGSPQYMAPEQADPARAGQADFRSDIYSATVVLYEMLADRLPLPFLSVTDLQRAETVGAPQAISIRELRPDVGPDLARIIDQGLARDPERRPRSAWEWREALKWCLLGTGAAERERLARKGSVARAVEGERPAPGGSVVGAVADERAVDRSSGSPDDGASFGTDRSPTMPAPTRKSTAVLRTAAPASAAGVQGSSVPIPLPPPGALQRGPGSSPRPTQELAFQAAPRRFRRPGGQFGRQPGPDARPPPAPKGGPPFGGPVSSPPSSELVPQFRQALVRLAGLLAIAAAISVVAGLLLPWASILQVRSGSTERLGMAFRGGNLALIGAIVLAVAGWRMWQGRRWWAAAMAASAALLAGLGASALALYEVVVIRDRVAGTIPAVQQGADVTIGVGLYVVLGGGLVGFLAGCGALRRLRRQRRAERLSATGGTAVASGVGG